MLKLRTDTQTTDVRAMTNTYSLVIDKACHVFLVFAQNSSIFH